MAAPHIRRLSANTRGLTVRQPWASLIAEAGKDTENRSWTTRWRGTLLIHAGLTLDPVPVPDARLAGYTLPLGAVVAVATLADCHRAAPGCCTSTWAEPDAVHWVLTGVRDLIRPVPTTGARGLWRPAAPPRRAVERLAAQPLMEAA